MRAVHIERHRLARTGWLRAAVLGANDGIVSTASLVIGVAAASENKAAVLIAGAAGLVAGAMSMAAGEYVSVSSQADTEKSDIARETRELRDQPELELEELAGIYAARGLTPELARQVAEQLMAKDALGAHARDELGISEISTARPLQAAIASAAAFAAGALLPLLVALAAPMQAAAPLIAAAALVSLALLGAVGARLGGATIWRPVARVAFWGALAMAISAAIGSALGVVV
jgi:VIT1/CCC1 family predicted Fe2+/Mn2+ transporter